MQHVDASTETKITKSKSDATSKDLPLSMLLPSKSVINDLELAIQDLNQEKKSSQEADDRFCESFFIALKKYLSTDEAKINNLATGVCSTGNAVMSTITNVGGTRRLSATAGGELLISTLMMTGSILQRTCGDRAHNYIDSDFIKQISGFSNAFRFAFEALCRIIVLIPGIDASSDYSMGAVLACSAALAVTEFVRQWKTTSTPPSAIKSLFFASAGSAGFVSMAGRIYESFPGVEKTDFSSKFINISTAIAALIPPITYLCRLYKKPERSHWVTTVNCALFDTGSFLQAVQNKDAAVIGFLLSAKLVPFGINRCLIKFDQRNLSLQDDPHQQLLPKESAQTSMVRKATP